MDRVAELTKELQFSDDKQVAVVVMASGVSKRFGENKLFAALKGKTLLGYACQKTHNPLFSKRLVITRTQRAVRYCKDNSIPVLLHDMPDRNQAIRLGIENLEDADCVLFLQCDQPMVSEKSINNLVNSWREAGFKGIHRLSFDGEGGSPVLFSKEYFEELKQLPSQKGGSYIIKNHQDSVHLVEAQSSIEMMDVDTKEELETLEKMI